MFWGHGVKIKKVLEKPGTAGNPHSNTPGAPPPTGSLRNPLGSVKCFYLLYTVNFQGRLCLEIFFFYFKRNLLGHLRLHALFHGLFVLQTSFEEPRTRRDSIAGQDTRAQLFSVCNMGLALLPWNSHRAFKSFEFSQ